MLALTELPDLIKKTLFKSTLTFLLSEKFKYEKNINKKIANIKIIIFVWNILFFNIIFNNLNQVVNISIIFIFMTIYRFYFPN